MHDVVKFVNYIGVIQVKLGWVLFEIEKTNLVKKSDEK